jgi:hypothetical protein
MRLCSSAHSRRGSTGVPLAAATRHAFHELQMVITKHPQRLLQLPLRPPDLLVELVATLAESC